LNIGTCYIPDIRLNPSLIQSVEIIYNKFESRDVDYETLAPLLGHASSMSGAFTSKMAVMRAYNLIEGRGKVRVTETGRKIALPNTSSERNEGLIEAVTSIPLWKELWERYTKFGKDLPTSDFWLELRQICGISPEEAQRRAEYVQKAYLDDIQGIEVPKTSGVEPATGIQQGQPVGPMPQPTPQVAPITAEVISFRDGGIEIRLPKERLKETWEKVKRMVDIFVESSL